MSGVSRYGFWNSQGTQTKAFRWVSGSSKQVEDQGQLGYSPTIQWPLYSMYTNYRDTHDITIHNGACTDSDKEMG